MSQVYLVGIDCSDCGNRALEYAASRAEVNGDKIVVAHVIEWSPYSFNTNEENAERHKRREAELDRAHRDIVDPIVASLKERGIDAEGAVRHGHIAKTINALAAEYGAGCIVVGRTGHSTLVSHLFGSVPGALVQISDVPVTVVP